MIGRMMGLTEMHVAALSEVWRFDVSEGERSAGEGRGMAQHRARPSPAPSDSFRDTRTKRAIKKEGLAS